MRRVVVTGIGMVSPLATGVELTWSRLIAGGNAAGRIDGFEIEDLACQIACQIRRGDGSDGTFNPDLFMEPKEQRKVDDFIIYAMAAAQEALNDASWHPESYEDQISSGVLIGSGIGGLSGIVEGAYTLRDKGPRRVSPFFIPGRLINLASGQVSIRHGLKGPNHSVVTACSTGAHAIGDASRLIALGDADVMVAGGTESPINRMSIAGFSACKALCFAYAGIVVLEEYEHAKLRGAKIYAEIAGYGLSGDAYHITAPAEDGDGAFRSMSAAIKRAGISAADLDYVNAHGTSTMADTIELGAVERLVAGSGRELTMSSTKSAVGHLLGAAGAVEAIFSILAIRDNIAPPTLNLDNPAVETKIDLVPHAAKKKKIDVALSNSFGFGGTNASLVLKRCD
jgi:3-oxoacyl-[acyl-carrier-protein] synthase II